MNQWVTEKEKIAQATAPEKRRILKKLVGKEEEKRRRKGEALQHNV